MCTAKVSKSFNDRSRSLRRSNAWQRQSNPTGLHADPYHFIHRSQRNITTLKQPISTQFQGISRISLPILHPNFTSFDNNGCHHAHHGCNKCAARPNLDLHSLPIRHENEVTSEEDGVHRLSQQRRLIRPGHQRGRQGDGEDRRRPGDLRRRHAVGGLHHGVGRSGGRKGAEEADQGRSS